MKRLTRAEVKELEEVVKIQEGLPCIAVAGAQHWVDQHCFFFRGTFNIIKLKEINMAKIKEGESKKEEKEKKKLTKTKKDEDEMKKMTVALGVQSEEGWRCPRRPTDITGRANGEGLEFSLFAHSH